MLLMWISTLRTPARIDRIEHFNHAAHAALREMSHVLASLLRETEADHFIVGPDGAVDQQQVRFAHRIEHVIFERAEPPAHRKRACPSRSW